MVSINQRQTATIYEFPTGALRQAKSFIRDDERMTGKYSDLAFGGSWYHDEALHEAASVQDKPVN